MTNTTQNPACHCHNKNELNQSEATQGVKKTFKSLPGVLLSVGIAFFPKCPVCWAAYMSMFGSVGLSNIPYMKWLLPFLVVFLLLNLYFIFRKVKERGYGPFLCSLAGAVIIICGKLFFADIKAILFLGMLLILSGSLWNSFSAKSFGNSVPVAA